MESMPLAIQDIESSILFKYSSKDNIYCVGSKSTNTYFFIKGEYTNIYMRILKQMNGKQTVGQIKEKFITECPEGLVDKIYNTCLKCNLITNEKKKDEKEFDELKATYKDVLAINISRICQISNRISYKFYITIASIMVIIFAFALLNIREVFGMIPWGSVAGDLRVLIYSVLISSLSVFAHEMSHAFIAAKFGLPINTAQIATFTYFTFACYIKLPGIYFLKPIKRILIWSAGIFTNLFFIALSILVFNIVGSQGQLLLSMVIICNISTIFSAVVPFYISDGYFILSTLFKAPNLRKDVFTNITNFFKTGKLYFTSFIYLLYFIITIIFTIGVVGFILFPIIINIIRSLLVGISLKSLFLQYINIFIVVIALFVSKIIRLLIKKIKKGGTE